MHTRPKLLQKHPAEHNYERKTLITLYLLGEQLMNNPDVYCTTRPPAQYGILELGEYREAVDEDVRSALRNAYGSSHRQDPTMWRAEFLSLLEQRAQDETDDTRREQLELIHDVFGIVRHRNNL